jgi:hypothetical protein
MVKHISSQKASRACRGSAKCYSYSGATVSTLELVITQQIYATPLIITTRIEREREI